MKRLGRNGALARRLRALRRDASLRRDEGVLIAEGPSLVVEGLAAGLEVEALVVSPELSGTRDGRNRLERFRAAAPDRLWEADDDLVRALQDARSAQPALALLGRPPARVTPIGDAAPPWILIADGVQDPGNLGALVRTAEAAGVGAVWLTGDGADPFHPRAVRGSAGALFRIPVWSGDWTDACDAARKTRARLVGTVAHGGEPLDSSCLDGAVAVVVGNEGHGLDAAQRASLEACVSIPMSGELESLSVGAAAAILLYEIRRRRVTSGPPASG